MLPSIAQTTGDNGRERERREKERERGWWVVVEETTFSDSI